MFGMEESSEVSAGGISRPGLSLEGDFWYTSVRPNQGTFLGYGSKGENPKGDHRFWEDFSF